MVVRVPLHMAAAVGACVGGSLERETEIPLGPPAGPRLTVSRYLSLT